MSNLYERLGNARPMSDLGLLDNHRLHLPIQELDLLFQLVWIVLPLPSQAQPVWLEPVRNFI
jgi:hypothetical protein